MSQKELFPEVKKISKVAQNILKKRYYYKDEDRWEQIVDRVVDYVIPKWSKSDRELMGTLMRNTYFIPNSPCLVNSGKPGAGLCACFVVDFPDTIEGIIKTKGDFMYIARKGGGCGTSLTKLRPEGARVSGSTHGYAGGGVKFANTISHDANALTQSGFRAMAIMFTESVYHPDILKFITAKSEEGKIANANISVVVDDDFMKAVVNGEKYWTRFRNFDKESPNYGEWENYDQYDARTVFDMIVDGMWKNGEPGLLYKNRIDNSPYAETGQEIFATNPCSEQPLPPNGVCNLGSLDLSKFYNKKENEIEWNKLEIATKYGIRFLDAVVDASEYPTPDINQWAKSNRAIGLGIMGFADLLLMMKVAYGSEESLEILGEVLSFISDVSLKESEKLGAELGIPDMCMKLSKPRRNVTVTTIAPTGTISLIAGCSSGIEPIFSEIVIRNDKTGTYTFENDLADSNYFRCAVSSNGAQEVTWEEHINVLATAQQYIDSGVSKTINFPTGTKRETMAKAAIMAWEEGCKGVAMYRNGSRKSEVLSPKNIKKDKCPVCSGELVDVDGKLKCVSCNIDEVIEKTVGSYDS